MRYAIGCGLLVLVIMQILMYIGLDKMMIGEYRESKSKEVFQLIAGIIAFEVLFVALMGYAGIEMMIG